MVQVNFTLAKIRGKTRQILPYGFRSHSYFERKFIMSELIMVATVQFNHRANDKNYNFSRIEYFVKQAARKAVKLIVFPEMGITGYWHVRNLSQQAINDLAEEVPNGPSCQKLLALSQKYNMIIGAGLLESARGKVYNSYLVCMPDGSVKTHRKLHAFESTYISSGDSYTVFDTPLGVKIGVLICYDNNIFENVRMTALLGADILLAPHQTGGTNSVSPYGMKPIDVSLWRNRDKDPKAIREAFKGGSGRGWLMRWLPSRAHDNGLFILFSNGVGEDDGEVRTGNAMIIDPYGRIIKETWVASDAMVVAALDLALLENSTGRRWLRARRPDLYQPLAVKTGKELDPIQARFSLKKT
jgi:predicted amidohydrolase